MIRALLWVVLLLTGGLVIGVAVACQHRPVDRTAATAWVAGRHPGVMQLSSEALAGLPVGSYLLVDVRPPTEWSVSHLRGAFRSENAGEVLDEIHHRRPERIIVYCSIGERSSRLAEGIQAQHPDLPIFNLSGGIFSWACENRPLEDADGRPTRLVHPYDATWGALLPADRRAPLPGSPP